MAENRTANRQAFKSPTSNKAKGAPPRISADSGSGGKGFTLAIIGLVVIGLGVVAWLATQRESDLPTEAQTAAVEYEGSPLPSFPRDSGLAVTGPGTDAAVGQTAPTLTGTNFDGDPVTIGADGRAKVVYFLAHWCPHCQDELPKVQALVNQGQKPEDLDLYAVSTSVDDRPNANYPPQLWLEREGWTGSVMRDSDASNAFAAYGGGGFPYVVYLDGQNNVLARSSGELDNPVTLQLWNLTAAGDTGSAVEGDGEERSEVDAEGNPVDTTDTTVTTDSTETTTTEGDG